MATLAFVKHDGGRAAAGFKGKTRDCVTRAIAIATNRPYITVYDELNAACRAQCRRAGRRRYSARTGVPTAVIRRYLDGIGWRWKPTMQIGQGCKTHLRAGEIPKRGHLIVSLSRHLVTVIDGVIYDLADPSCGGMRCVYGYWTPPDQEP